MTTDQNPTQKQASAKQRNIIMTTRKLRRVINEVRGKKAIEAYNMLRMMPYRASDVVLKKLIDAIHNARVKYNVSPEQLYISEILADGGRTLVRYKPRAQGRIYRREKRTSHLSLTVSVIEDAVTTA